MIATKDQVNGTRKEIGARLFNLAIKWSQGIELPGNQKYRESEIKAMKGRKKTIHGSKSIKVAREAVETATSMVRQRRTLRARYEDRGFTSRPKTDFINRPKPVNLPKGSLDERLQAFVADSVEIEASHNYRLDDAGHLRVKITREPSEVGVRQSAHNDWDYYSRRNKFPKKITNTVITVPRDWRLRVLAKGLEDIGGLLTLDAQKLEGMPKGFGVYAAVWLEQGRGYDLHAKRGYIAFGLGESYHGKTPEKALAGVRRKAGIKKADAALVNLLEPHKIEEIAAQHPEINVSVQDARATGSCEYGIRSWCHRTGLPYKDGQAPLIDVYRAYQSAPLPEARAAILKALRRNKRKVLKKAA